MIMWRVLFLVLVVLSLGYISYQLGFNYMINNWSAR